MSRVCFFKDASVSLRLNTVLIELIEDEIEDRIRAGRWTGSKRLRPPKEQPRKKRVYTQDRSYDNRFESSSYRDLGRSRGPSPDRSVSPLERRDGRIFFKKELSPVRRSPVRRRSPIVRRRPSPPPPRRRSPPRSSKTFATKLGIPANLVQKALDSRRRGRSQPIRRRSSAGKVVDMCWTCKVCGTIQMSAKERCKECGKKFDSNMDEYIAGLKDPLKEKKRGHLRMDRVGRSRVGKLSRRSRERSPFSKPKNFQTSRGVGW